MKFRAEEAVFIGLFIFFSLTILFPEVSIAGTGGEELKTLYDKTVEIAQGYGGKSIAAISFILSGISMLKGNMMACGGAFATGTIIGVGPKHGD